MKKILNILLLLLCTATMAAQERFVYLTTKDVQIDSIMPNVGCAIPLPDNYTDSVYTVKVAYPEYINMPPSDIERYFALGGAPLSASPKLRSHVVFNRKKPFLKIDVTPLAEVSGQKKWVVSFMLKISATAVKHPSRASRNGQEGVYAPNSVLATGRWAKIRVGETGVHELTPDVVKRAGFTDINKVKIYGYGGNLQPERITAAYLKATDDLQEVPQHVVRGRHLFYAKGAVSYASSTTNTRIRNPYSDHGYYFITQSDGDVATLDSASFVAQYAESAERFHTLYERDAFAWHQGGRNLFDPDGISLGQERSYNIANPMGETSGNLHVVVTAGANSVVEVKLNGEVIDYANIALATYDHGEEYASTLHVTNLQRENTLSLKVTSGGVARLDYICLTSPTPITVSPLTASYKAAEYVGRVTNQNLHAHNSIDMVIIIPSSQKLRAQAERLKAFHEKHDGMTVSIVTAEELYNEFASGTPDANAYRRYMKMLYDRAATVAEQPKYLLLFGDCIWDNRMLTSATQKMRQDDYLLCFESENSYSSLNSYVDDGFFTLLDEGEGTNPMQYDIPDIAVGRFPVSTEKDAKAMVDKTISYAENHNTGAWQNTLAFLGDDGNDNRYMKDAYDASVQVETALPDVNIQRVIWDNYTRVLSANSATYPEVTARIKKLHKTGALVFNYLGHGSATQLSHEQVLFKNDMKNMKNANLPLWVAATCDIMPFDSSDTSFGEEAVTNPDGGAVAFFGTTRTVYATYNQILNLAYLRYLLSTTDGRPNTIGDAQRLAKTHLITSGKDDTINKLQFSLIGDPALRLNLPERGIAIDKINGSTPDGSAKIQLKAGSTATVEGHITGNDTYNGVVSLTLRDNEETVVCRLNNTTESGAEKAFTYIDRPKILFSGVDSVRQGRFNMSFKVPMDINYSGESGLITLVATSNGEKKAYNGSTTRFTVGGSDDINDSHVGPSLYCYLNSPDFTEGGTVNAAPYFVAQIKDEDGINTSGIGIGHDLQLTVDNDPSMTYVLNDNFTFNFGSYTEGTTFYQLPPLSEGMHTLKFRAWDIYNNPSTATLSFRVNKSLTPVIDINVTENPAKTQTTFIVSHDRMGSNLDIEIEVFDTSGRLLWSKKDVDTSGTGTYTTAWNLCGNGGQNLQTGVYIYRVSASSDGSKQVSKSKKLIVFK